MATLDEIKAALKEAVSPQAVQFEGDNKLYLLGIGELVYVEHPDLLPLYGVTKPVTVLPADHPARNLPCRFNASPP